MNTRMDAAGRRVVGVVHEDRTCVRTFRTIFFSSDSLEHGPLCDKVSGKLLDSGNLCNSTVVFHSFHTSRFSLKKPWFQG